VVGYKLTAVAAVADLHSLSARAGSAGYSCLWALDTEMEWEDRGCWKLPELEPPRLFFRSLFERSNNAALSDPIERS
jgi:hypothetical protein